MFTCLVEVNGNKLLSTVLRGWKESGVAFWVSLWASLLLLLLLWTDPTPTHIPKNCCPVVNQMPLIRWSPDTRPLLCFDQKLMISCSLCFFMQCREQQPAFISCSLCFTGSSPGCVDSQWGVPIVPVYISQTTGHHPCWCYLRAHPVPDQHHSSQSDDSPHILYWDEFLEHTDILNSAWSLQWPVNLERTKHNSKSDHRTGSINF